MAGAHAAWGNLPARLNVDQEGRRFSFQVEARAHSCPTWPLRPPFGRRYHLSPIELGM